MGSLIATKGLLTCNRPKEYYDSEDWRGGWDTEGGGVLINQAVHTLDYFNYITGGVLGVKAKMMNFSLSAPEFETVFEKEMVRYTNGKLFVDGEVIKEDVVSTGVKAYWGNGHKHLIVDYYDKNKYFSLGNIKNTMDTLFAMYDSANQNGKEILL